MILFGVIWAFGLAGYLGIPLTIVTIAGLPVLLGIGIDYAIQMHARVEEEVIIDRADHPIQETARGLGPGPAGGHLRRHLRLRRPALRQGADDPRVRPAAGGRHRRHLPGLDRPAPGRPRHPGVQVAHEVGQGLQRGLPRAVRRAPGLPARPGPPSPWASPASPSSWAASPSRTTSSCRPTRSSGSTRSRARSRTSVRSRPRWAARASWACSPRPTTSSPTSSPSSPTTSRTTPSPPTPTTCSTASSIEAAVGGLLQVPGASDIAPDRRRGRGRLRGGPAPTSRCRRSARTARPST